MRKSSRTQITAEDPEGSAGTAPDSGKRAGRFSQQGKPKPRGRSSSALAGRSKHTLSRPVPSSPSQSAVVPPPRGCQGSCSRAPPLRADAGGGAVGQTRLTDPGTRRTTKQPAAQQPRECAATLPCQQDHSEAGANKRSRTSSELSQNPQPAHKAGLVRWRVPQGTGEKPLRLRGPWPLAQLLQRSSLPAPAPSSATAPQSHTASRLGQCG